ncbi:MAG: hemerythrin domain-containing protein [Armatimonadetes bacterium]|nr:hemerythrin domain-containing protein [Armatimonadota bacterium]
MPIQIGAKPESSFADPLGLLSDCHRRIEKFLRHLTLVTEKARGGPLDAEQRQALETALRYFREAAPRHTRDEEESLFPRLRAAGSADAQMALAALDALEADHDAADAHHAAVDQLGRQWLDTGHLSPGETDRLAGLLARLTTLYGWHIGIEDTQVFPRAARVLDAAAIRQVGREMAERRGLDLDTLPDLRLRCPTTRDMPPA